MRLFILALMFVSFSFLLKIPVASAYYVPPDYRDGVYSDFDVWRIASVHYPENWTQPILSDLARRYTNSGKRDDFGVLSRVMMRNYGLSQCFLDREMAISYNMSGAVLSSCAGDNGRYSRYGR